MCRCRRRWHRCGPTCWPAIPPNPPLLSLGLPSDPQGVNNTWQLSDLILWLNKKTPLWGVEDQDVSCRAQSCAHVPQWVCCAPGSVKVCVSSDVMQTGSCATKYAGFLQNSSEISLSHIICYSGPGSMQTRDGFAHDLRYLRIYMHADRNCPSISVLSIGTELAAGADLGMYNCIKHCLHAIDMLSTVNVVLRKVISNRVHDVAVTVVAIAA